MKIGINFHTSDRYISGVEYYTLGLINSLLRIDGKNEYVVFTNQPELIKNHVIQSGNLAIRKLDYLKTRLQRILWEHSRLPQIAKNEGLDVLHCPHYICPFVNVGTPYVVTIHDTIAISHPGWCRLSNALYYNILMKRTAKKVSRVIAVSRSTADSLKRHLSLDSSRVRVVYPGIDAIFNREINHLRQSQVKRRYGLPKRYILFVGNIEPKKNILRLLQVCELLQDKGLLHKLVLSGKRSWRCRNVWGHIHRELNSGDIILTGYVERRDLPFVYQMADVFVFLSLYEGFGFPPLEAMACGTPVVSSNKGALNETIRDAALTVEPHDIQQITQAILSMIADRSLRERHIRMGLRQSSLFSWERTAKQTLSVYEEAFAAND